MIAMVVAGSLAGTAAAQCPLHQTAKLTGAGGDCGLSGCRFGYSVSISADGSTALVGAQGDSNFIGAAHVFARSGSGWVQQGAKFTPVGGLGANQYYGCATALSADGNTALVGAYGDNNSIGAVYVYTRAGGEWTQQGPKLTPTGAVGQLGYFGFSLGVSADGNTAIIGAQGDNGYAGAAYVFVRSGGAWSQQAKLAAGAAGIGLVQYYGNAVAISGDGGTVGVGAYGDNFFLGAAYFYVRTGTAWAQQGPKFTAGQGIGSPQYFGSAMALSYDGNTALVGAYGDNAFVGSAYNHNRFGTVWLQQQKFLPVGPSGAGRYGTTVALSYDGNTALIGAPSDAQYAGAAYRCVRNTTTGGWSQPTPKFVAMNAAGNGSFGNSVAMDSAGGTLLMGAYGDAAAAGAAYVVSRDAACPADFNCSGTLNAQDMFDFLAAWFAMDPRSDFNGTGGITAQDIFDYLSAWFAGC